MNNSKANKRPRQERALARLQERKQFWADALNNEVTEVDGRPVDPEKKLALATFEETMLAAKGIK